MQHLHFILKWFLSQCLRKWLLFLLIQLNLQYYQAANRYWVATTTGSCNVSANWSASSGGAGGASVPTSADNAFFDGAGGANGNCIINVNATINNITLSSGYTGALVQNAGITFLINGSSTWSGGTFTGGNSTITNIGAFTLSGTLFTSTSNTLIIRGTFNFSSGTFSHNNGTVDFQNNNFTISGAPVFYNLKNTPSYNTLTITSSFTVTNNFTLSGSGASEAITTASGVTLSVLGNLYKIGDNYIQFNVGTIDVKGDIICSNTASGNGGSGTFNISGTTAQLLSSSANAQYGRLPSIRINKSSGILSLSGTITVGGPNWTYVAGTIDPGSSTLHFYSEPGSSYITIAGTQTLNNVILYPYYSTTTISGNLAVNNFTMDGSSSSDIALSSTLTVNGNFYMTGMDQLKISNGLLNVKGDIYITNTNVNGGGTGTLQILGTGNQSITNTGGGLGTGMFPNVTINKPSGTLSLSGNISSLGPNWNYVSGTIDPGTSTVYLYRQPGGSNINITGTHTLNNLYITSYYNTATISNSLTINSFTIEGSTSNAITVSSVLNINGALTTNGTDVLTINTGTVNLSGNINYSNTNIGSGGTAVFNIVGTSNQSITGTGVVNQSKLPANVILNKPSGNLVVAGGVPFYIYNAINFTQGIIVSSSSQPLIFVAGASVTGTPSNTCYVDGPVRKIGNTAFTFPVGENNYYAPISISAPTNVAHAFTAEYFNADPNTSYSVSLKDPSIDHLSRCEYWDLQRTTGTSNVSVTVSWDTPRSCVVNNITDLRVVHWDPNLTTPIWKDMGIGTTTGNNTTGTIRSNSLVTSFSPFSLGSATSFNPLPIKLVSFTGECIKEEVQLEWVIATELNNDYFEIERSTSASEWESINRIKGKGTSTSKQTYFAIDSTPKEGLSYYRLKQVDFGEGKYQTSPIIVIKSCKKNQEEIMVFPNPVKSTFSLTINEANPNFEIQIRDNIGKIIFANNYHTKQVTIDMSHFDNGTYFVNYITSTHTKTTPITFLKD